jgi:hypothetical protein
MKKIPIFIIIITIFVFLFLLVFIASKAINNEDISNVKKVKSEVLFQKEYFFPVNSTKNQNTFTFDTSYINNDSLYILTGEFKESSLSIWENENLIYNKICDGIQGYVFYKNKNLVNQGFYKVFDIYPDIKIKNNGINLDTLSQNPENLIVTINNYKNCKAYYYSNKINPL